jgi:hypothetical protein
VGYLPLLSPPPSLSLPPSQVGECGQGETGLTRLWQRGPTDSPSSTGEELRPDLRQDSALHTLMQARLAVLSDLAASRGASFSHSHSLDLRESVSLTERAGASSAATHRRSISAALVRHSSLSATSG